MIVKEPIILKCQPKSYPVEYKEALETLILLPAKVKDANGVYVANPEIIGGFTEDGVKAIQRNQGRLYKWGAINQKYLEEINSTTQEVEVEDPNVE